MACDYKIVVLVSCVLVMFLACKHDAKPTEPENVDSNVAHMEIKQDTPTDGGDIKQDTPNVGGDATSQPPTNVAGDQGQQQENSPPGEAGAKTPETVTADSRRKQEELDWGAQGWNDHRPLQQQQQEHAPPPAQQQQAQPPQQQQEQAQPPPQQEAQPPAPKQEQEMEAETEQQQVNSESQPSMGVIDPEEIMHGDGVHGHDHGGSDVHGGKVVDPVAALEEAKRHGEAKHQAEGAELDVLQPQVQANVHDGAARNAAEFLKNQQYGPNDIEEIVHGGHHVHGDDHDPGKDKVQGGDVEAIAHGQGGVHEDHGDGKNQRQHLTVDPEEMMHGGTGEAHDHGAHAQPEKQPQPGGDAPEDEMLTKGLGQEPKVKEEKDIGPTFEKAVHGEDHVHDHDPNYRPKNIITYKDIIDLGLTEEQLKGIDLNKVLEQEQREFDNWQQQELGNDPKDPAYWNEQVKSLRQQYIEKIYAKIRDISQPDLEHAEWEDWDDEIHGLKDPSQLHDGETPLEHEMEMWGRTEPKANRQPYKALHGRRGMNEELEEEGQQLEGEEKPQGDL
ncbi:unnamed protein product [Lymnaea stagnalis]|uniref:Uncharacterized protein n=1 Tax=Lymnaea stagnalis TaxID=6523 RepID=A0AAV2HKE6_LYMST